MANKRFTHVVYLLSQYRLSVQRVDRCMAEACEWQRRAAVIGIDKCQAVIDTINAEAAAAAHDRSVAEALICSIEDERQRLILRMRFYDGLTLEQIASNLNLDERWIFRLQRKAMEQLLIHPLAGG